MKTVEEVLSGAIDIINEVGWCQRSPMDREGRVCLEGALWRAAGGLLSYDRLEERARAGGLTRDTGLTTYRLAIERVGDVLAGDYPERGREPAFVYNDNDAQSADDVIGVLKRAIDLP